jgi:hypothetical protein
MATLQIESNGTSTPRSLKLNFTATVEEHSATGSAINSWNGGLSDTLLYIRIVGIIFGITGVFSNAITLYAFVATDQVWHRKLITSV